MIRFAFVLLLILPACIFGQQKNQDFGNWIRADFIFDINKNLNLNSRLELRAINNSSEIAQLFSEFSAKYKINNYIKTSIAWRPKLVNKELNYQFQNRFHFDLTFIQKWGALSLFSRIRSQYTIVPTNFNPCYERFRIKSAYKFNKKIKIFLYNEFYFHLNNLEGLKYNKNRFGTGLEYKINKSLNLEFKYLRIKEIQVPSPEIMNVLGVGLSHELN